MSEIKVGDIIPFGAEEYSWRVLDVQGRKQDVDFNTPRERVLH
jgi:FKBP-type peptidyl-prolyl cis-trans isomerase 2